MLDFFQISEKQYPYHTIDDLLTHYRVFWPFDFTLLLEKSKRQCSKNDAQYHEDQKLIETVMNPLMKANDLVLVPTSVL